MYVCMLLLWNKQMNIKKNHQVFNKLIDWTAYKIFVFNKNEQAEK